MRICAKRREIRPNPEYFELFLLIFAYKLPPRQRCDANDYFILYFEGHGTVLRDPDYEGTHDEAFVLVDPSAKAKRHSGKRQGRRKQ